MSLPERGSLGIGEAAAIGTALSWSACAQFFAAAGRRVGSVAVNHVRLVFALALLPLMHLVVGGGFFPRPTLREFVLLSLSGVVGIALGDAAGFRALVLIGAARTTLVVTLTPAVATLLASAFLGERLTMMSLVGMGVTLAGLLLGVVVRWRTESRQEGLAPQALGIGLLCAVGGAVGQASGQVLAKPALSGIDPLSATLVRVAAAAVLLWGFTAVSSLVRRRPPRWWGAWGDRRAMGLTLLGTLAGPTCGIWLSLIATKHAPIGVAATLMALVPLFVLAQDALILRRRPPLHEVAGALVAIAGVVLLVKGTVPG